MLKPWPGLHAGNWYPWGQQPSEYVATYQRVHDTLQSGTCGVDMVWGELAGLLHS